MVLKSRNEIANGNSILLALVLLLSPAALSSFAEDVDRPVDFNRDIRPLFNAHCTACHGGVKQAADLSFVYEDAIAEVVEPGNAADSHLIERVTSSDEDERMPPPEHGRGLNEAEIELLTRWINQGAKWGKHWAYEIPHRYKQPAVSDPDWIRQPVDAFVLAKLEALSQKPAADENPRRWFRRASLDVIGLPPTIEQNDAFLRDLEKRGEPAYAAAVDRLLASEHFGERWASVWFDLVRYADSRGLGLDNRRNVWKYRDWVIQSLNDDMPYDQFTLKQIAGDLQPEPTIDDQIATTVHRLTQSNDEGGTDDEEFRVAAILDRVNTTWQTWQGTSFGCVQCHHHPYDPFAHDEYYQFAAFFNNTADSDLPTEQPLLQVPIDPNDYERAGDLDRKVNALQQSIWASRYRIATEVDWQLIPMKAASSTTATRVVIDQANAPPHFHTVGTVTNDTGIQIECDGPAVGKTVKAIRLTALPLNPKTALADSEWGFVLSNFKVELVSGDDAKSVEIKLSEVIGDEPFPFYNPADSLHPKTAQGYSAFSRIHHPRRAVFVLKEGLTLNDGDHLRISMKHMVESGGSHPLMIHRGYFEFTSDKKYATKDQNIEAEKDEMTRLKAEREKITSTFTPIISERPDHLKRPTHVFNRGLFLTKGKEVSANIPLSLRSTTEEKIGDRLALANWMVSEKNPLIARVAVNRIWARLFGTGIVSTEEDFGSTGEKPSHPELLDDLAVRFREDYRWSIKQLVREIVLSRTYRQSATTAPQTFQADPRNRTLARGPRQTLSAEMVRDQALAISGLLSDKMFGPPVYPPLPDGLWTPFDAGDKWTTPKRGEADRYRRSVYTYTKRSIPFPVQATFDAPSREFCEPRRLRSNTPLQPLMTLNDEAFVECAEALALRMRKHDESVDKQIAYGFLLATGREANDAEIAELAGLYLQLCSISAKPSTEIALNSIAAVLLNLDEVLTR